MARLRPTLFHISTFSYIWQPFCSVRNPFSGLDSLLRVGPGIFELRYPISTVINDDNPITVDINRIPGLGIGELTFLALDAIWVADVSGGVTCAFILPLLTVVRNRRFFIFRLISKDVADPTSDRPEIPDRGLCQIAVLWGSGNNKLRYGKSNRAGMCELRHLKGATRTVFISLGLWPIRSKVINRDVVAERVDVRRFLVCRRGRSSDLGRRSACARLHRGRGYCIAPIIGAGLVVGKTEWGLPCGTCCIDTSD
jgi:hypothetical protein